MPEIASAARSQANSGIVLRRNMVRLDRAKTVLASINLSIHLAQAPGLPHPVFLQKAVKHSPSLRLCYQAWLHAGEMMLHSIFQKLCLLTNPRCSAYPQALATYRANPGPSNHENPQTPRIMQNNILQRVRHARVGRPRAANGSP